MYPARPGLLIGFHGCEKAIRDDIIAGKRVLIESANGHDFATNPPGNKKIETPSVLGAVIDLQFCLDLLDTVFLNRVKFSYYSLSRSAKMIGKELPHNRPTKYSKDLLIRELDYAVIENLHLERARSGVKPFDSVRGVFTEGTELYPGAGFHDKNHIQICIRNPNCIKGYFLPRSEVQWPLAS